MRIYFFGDIHGNLEALEQCLRHAEAVRAERLICLGDLVGWLPFGDETLARMRELSVPTVAGNHDLLVAGAFEDHPTQRDRIAATAYTRALLEPIPGAIDTLINLPLALDLAELTVVHHSPFDLPPRGVAPHIGCFDYLDERALAEHLIAWQEHPKHLIVSGHDHIPAVYELPLAASPPRIEDVTIHRPGADAALTIPLRPDCRYWVKAGSVGGPYRDGIPMANSVLYDSEAQTLTLYRIDYPRQHLHAVLAAHPLSREIPTLKRYLELLERFGNS